MNIIKIKNFARPLDLPPPSRIPSYALALCNLVLIVYTNITGYWRSHAKNKDNTHPWVLCVGSPTSISSAVLVCQKKVVSKDIGKTVFSSILVLMAAHYAYEFAYNPMTQQVLEFLQEKLLGDPLQASRKPLHRIQIFSEQLITSRKR